MEWRDFLIEPVDVWLFRDGRPFSAGSDVWARTLPLPSPFTLLGALRTFFLTQAGISPKDFYERRVEQRYTVKWGSPDADPGQLWLRGPFWYHQDQIYFPAPADLVRVQDKSCCLQPLTLQKQDKPTIEIATNFPLNSGLLPLWLKSSEPVKAEGGYLSQKGFEEYLAAQSVSVQELKALSAFAEKERRTGIKVGEGRSVEEGYLYQAEFLRLKEGVQLYGAACLPNDTQPTEGILFLGGERRMGILRWKATAGDSSLATLIERFRNKAPSEKRVKVVLLSPAYFSQGWKPLNLNGWKLVAAAIPRLVPIGILQKAGGHIFQKRLYCVPPGSVYFFEREQDSSKLPDALTEDPFAGKGEREGRSPLKQLGFGLYATSTWDYV